MKQKLYIDVVNVRKSIKTGDKRMHMCMSFLTVEKFVVQKIGPCEATFRRVQYYFCPESTTFCVDNNYSGSHVFILFPVYNSLFFAVLMILVIAKFGRFRRMRLLDVIRDSIHRFHHLMQILPGTVQLFVFVETGLC
jgi:hypothetical protein